MTGTIVNTRLIDSIILFAPIAAKLPRCAANTPESRLAKGLRVDSAHTETLALQFHDHFDVVIEQDAVPNLGRKGEIAALMAGSGQAHFGSSCQGAAATSFATTFQ